MRKQLYTLATNTISRILKNPLYLILFVSYECPNKCRHCWYNEEWKKENLDGIQLTIDELEKISASISYLHFLSITGGEAFLRPDIEEIVNVFIKNSKIRRFDIPTSGFDCDLISGKVENILNKNKNTSFRVDVSIDGLEDTHNMIRRNNSAFSHAIETIESLKKIKTRNRNFDISIITTISDYNNKEVEPLSKFISKLLPDGEWMVNIIRGDTPEYHISKETSKAYDYANDFISNRINNKQFNGDNGHHLGKWLTAKNEVRRDIITEIISSERTGGGCAAGSLIGIIFNDGQVRGCETLKTTFGNIRDFDYNLPKLWNNATAKMFRKEIQDSECICTHECSLSASILLQPSCWMKLISKRIDMRF